MQINDDHGNKTDASNVRNDNELPLWDRTGFQRDLLRAIHCLGTPKGTEIQSTVQDWYGGKEVFYGRLYPNLDTLVDEGLIEKRKRERDSRTNEYELTNEGRDALAEYLLHREEVES